MMEVMKVMKVMEVMKGRTMQSVAAVVRRGPRICSFLSFITFITFSAAHAAEKPFAAPEIAQGSPASSAGGLMQVTLSLLLVLAAVFAAAWLMRRLRGFGNAGQGAIEIIADVPLSTKERAVLVQVGKQQLLLGVAPGRVATLHVLAEPVAVDSARHTRDGELTPAPGRPDFKGILKRSLGV